MTAIRHPAGFITRPDATLRRRVFRGTARAIEMTALLVIVGAVLRDGARLIGARPVVQVGPIGSRSDWLVAYLTDGSIRIDAGCQRQITRAEFETRLANTHGDDQHAREYRAALAYIDAHAAIWSDAA